MRREPWLPERAQLAAAAHRWPSAPGERPGVPDAEAGDELAILRLQRTAGNAAVSRAIRDLVVQRQPKRKKARPKWADDAMQTMRGMFPKEPLMQAVDVEDYGETNAALKDFAYGAWTNSKTVIYLRSPSAFADPDDPKSKDRPKQAIMATLHHEAQHIRQFARDGGPPKTWEQMLRYEEEAYKLDQAWLTGDAVTLIAKPLREELLAGAKKEYDIVVKLLAEAKQMKADTREQALRQRMIDEELVPTGSPKDPRDLYKQPAL